MNIMKITDQKSKYSHKGAGFMIAAVITASIVGLTALSMTKINQAAFSGLSSSKVIVQAQQYADVEAIIVKATGYENLEEHEKTAIPNSNDYFSEVVLSEESDYLEIFKQRTATINIYKGDEVLPRYSLDIPRIDVGAPSTGGVPAGTIIAWPGDSAPSELGTWLLCDGRTFTPSVFPRLYIALKSNVIPNLNGRFLEGTTGSPGDYKEAGLPNIKGFAAGFPWDAENHGVWTDSSKSTKLSPSGPFYGSGWARSGRKDGREGQSTYFDASRSSAVYGKSDTVQPLAFTVRYYIKAD